jgi:hypothetical protein
MIIYHIERVKRSTQHTEISHGFLDSVITEFSGVSFRDMKNGFIKCLEII